MLSCTCLWNRKGTFLERVLLCFAYLLFTEERMVTLNLTLICSVMWRGRKLEHVVQRTPGCVFLDWRYRSSSAASVVFQVEERRRLLLKYDKPLNPYRFISYWDACVLLTLSVCSFIWSRLMWTTRNPLRSSSWKSYGCNRLATSL